MALRHAVGDETEEAYGRGNVLQNKVDGRLVHHDAAAIPAVVGQLAAAAERGVEANLSGEALAMYRRCCYCADLPVTA